MGLEGKAAEPYILAREYIAVENSINTQSQSGIHPSAKGIAKGLLRHYFPERRIKQINGRSEGLLHTANLEYIAYGKTAPVSYEPSLVIIAQFERRLPVKRHVERRIFEFIIQADYSVNTRRYPAISLFEKA